MLFSHAALAERITRDFEPVWAKVREAPQVTIDFGGGNVVRRTLHGNIASWVLDAQGRALDVIPGIYTPEAYGARLDEALRFHRSMDVRHPHYGKPERLATWFADYHRKQADAIAAGGAALRLRTQGVTKAGIEMWALTAVGDDRDEGRTVLPGAKAQTPRPRVSDLAKFAVEIPVEEVAAPAAASRVRRDHLEADVRVNETERRPEIHHLLAATGSVVLDDALTRRLYREVLHCDLDDPYLGLGDALFKDYPFER